MKGWQVPAYTLPANLTEVTIMRIVVKEGMSLELANLLLADINSAIQYFEKLGAHKIVEQHGGFHH